jgi:hypothetical protein
MKTLNGITYVQLKTLTTAELNALCAAYAASQVFIAMESSGFADEGERDFADKFMQIFTRRAEEMFNEKVTDKIYSMMRILYDTEEKFDMASEMTTEMGNIAMMTQKMMKQIHQDVLAMR